ncbi:MAG: (d)CMP kinase [Chloroflexales bacterium]|nr:(d)CMP kinase [Chloroflexales bacterium]
MTIPRVITIDGPAGSGKSTLGANVAMHLGFLYFDTGIMYRALTLAVIEGNCDPSDAEAVTTLAAQSVISVQAPTQNDGRQYTIMLNERDVTWDIRQQTVEKTVSIAAAHPSVRQILRARQRAIGMQGNVVMVGRDIGSIVLPEAPLKIFLDVTIAERVRRRINELTARGEQIDVTQLTESIRIRDERDRHVMQPAVDAIYINGDNDTPEQTLASVLQFVANCPALR